MQYNFPINSPVLIGPGDFSYDTFVNYYEDFLNPYNIPLSVIDAGALNPCLEIFPKYAIFTPHEGEFRKIFNIDKISFININVLQNVQKKIDHKIIILKSFNTFIITKDNIYVMDNGPSVLSTAGSGDVLSGILVSLLSQGYSRLEASILGTYLHAEAANYYMNNISKDGMTASALIDCIPHAFNQLRNNG